MAPAITHFLVGASLLLVLAVPVWLRYDIPREYGLWLVPLGGLWGIAPDFHHIAPLFSTELHAIHHSSWVDLFAFHYTLDRPFVRGQYLTSVFASIMLFSATVAVYWSSFELHRAVRTGRWRLNPIANVGIATLSATVYATLAMTMVIGIQESFGLVSQVVGSDNRLIGAMLLGPIGLGSGMVLAPLFEWVATWDDDSNVLTTSGFGFVSGVVLWALGVGLLLPVWLRAIGESTVSIPLVHWGSLVVCVVFVTVFGGLYTLFREELLQDHRRHPFA